MEFINQSTVTSTVYQYDPYGAYQTTTATGSAAAQNPYRYVGGTYDRTTGWIKYGQRWYNPITGRFTTQDALSFLADPAQGNRYAYAGDDPINNTDPTGKNVLGDLVDGLDKIKTVYDIGTNIRSGNYVGAVASLAGEAAGAMTGATCASIAVGFGVTTGVGGLVVGTGCLVAEGFASYAGEDFVNREFG
ncbi:RHS repeat-associated core domain-containing protein [Streptomyces sp. NPDC088197]|uniref:RHS repeat-associated core domain-containing protein n=1 Tax=Streptomyces sp. NPDC088197 TaxID=3365840 RepID=UPI003808D715